MKLTKVCKPPMFEIIEPNEPEPTRIKVYHAPTDHADYYETSNTNDPLAICNAIANQTNTTNIVTIQHPHQPIKVFAVAKRPEKTVIIPLDIRHRFTQSR